MSIISQLPALWLEAKEAERQAIEHRRRIEDEMASMMAVAPDYEGTKTEKAGGYKIKVVYRINRKIDGDKLQQIAAEQGLEQYLGQLFRWKPEINSAVWKAAADDITRPLLGAITTTAGRPTFSIEIEE